MGLAFNYLALPTCLVVYVQNMGVGSRGRRSSPPLDVEIIG